MGGPWKSWGVTKKSRDFWMATNFNENFVKWNSPKNAYFLRYAHWGLHVSSTLYLWRGVIKFWASSRGVTKILPRYFRKFMTPLFQRKWWPPYMKPSPQKRFVSASLGPLFFGQKGYALHFFKLHFKAPLFPRLAADFFNFFFLMIKKKKAEKEKRNAVKCWWCWKLRHSFFFFFGLM